MTPEQEKKVGVAERELKRCVEVHIMTGRMRRRFARAIRLGLLIPEQKPYGFTAWLPKRFWRRP